MINWCHELEIEEKTAGNRREVLGVEPQGHIQRDINVCSPNNMLCTVYVIIHCMPECLPHIPSNPHGI